MRKDHMAVDQFGRTLHGLGAFPRKGLLERTGAKHIEKMYQDSNGQTHHTGYITGGHGGSWWTVYEVAPMRRPA